MLWFDGDGRPRSTHSALFQKPVWWTSCAGKIAGSSNPRPVRVASAEADSGVGLRGHGSSPGVMFQVRIHQIARAFRSAFEGMKVLPSSHIRCRMTDSFRARATAARRWPSRFCRRMPQAFSTDHVRTFDRIELPASTSSQRVSGSPHFDIRLL